MAADHPAGAREGRKLEKDPFSDRLKRLEDRIAAAKSAREAPAPREANEFTQGSLAWRMVTELVVGMLLGLAIGFGLDSLLGNPAGVPGAVRAAGLRGGVRTMMRTATEVQTKRGRSGTPGGRPNGCRGRPGPGEE